MLWWFGCWRASFENGGEAMFAGWGCGGEGGGGLGALLVVAIWLLGGDWSKIMIEKRKMANSNSHSPLNTEIPSKQRWGNLTTHILIDISNLRTFMV